MEWVIHIACVAGSLLAVHCGPGGNQSTFDPASRPAALINDLHWWMYYAFGAVYLVVCAALLWALWRAVRRQRREGPRPIEPVASTERRLVQVGALGAAATVAILFGFLVANLALARAINTSSTGDALDIEVTGYQWWWEIRYLDKSGAPLFATANEIHLPVGRPVRLHLASPDVIHSLWVPNLHGKRDLIPGHHTMLAFTADQAGVFRGQCAEFCGLQHAHMALVVVAEPPDRFARWLDRQTAPAAPRDDGSRLFAAAGCAECHTIRGTPARGERGPDLTHVASRPAIAAGTLPNTRATMAAWIRDPQAFKPGTQMPPGKAAPAELAALVAYLEGLR